MILGSICPQDNTKAANRATNSKIYDMFVWLFSFLSFFSTFVVAFEKSANFARFNVCFEMGGGRTFKNY